MKRERVKEEEDRLAYLLPTCPADVMKHADQRFESDALDALRCAVDGGEADAVTRCSVEYLVHSLKERKPDRYKYEVGYESDYERDATCWNGIVAEELRALRGECDRVQSEYRPRLPYAVAASVLRAVKAIRVKSLIDGLPDARRLVYEDIRAIRTAAEIVGAAEKEKPAAPEA